MSMQESKVMLQDEPAFYDGAALEKILVQAFTCGASDVTIRPGTHVKFHIHGRIHNVSKEPIKLHEAEAFVTKIYGGNGIGRIKEGNPIDTSMTIRYLGKFLRFRINVSGCRCEDGDGVQITARTIKLVPPSLKEMDVEREIVDAAYPDKGLVLVCGETGAGKSSLLAGLIANLIADNIENGVKIVTAEAPIEYVYDGVELGTCSIAQAEIPLHVASFQQAIHNAMRQNPDYILLGETRDQATMQSTLEAAVTGHTVYSTLHSPSVHETVYRALNLFPSDIQDRKVYEIVEALRLIVCQQLVGRVGGGRIAVREFLVFTEELRDELRSIKSVPEIIDRIKRATLEQGRSLAKSAFMLAERALINERDADVILRASSENFYG